LEPKFEWFAPRQSGMDRLLDCVAIPETRDLSTDREKLSAQI
jgi:hypothetical protein